MNKNFGNDFEDADERQFETNFQHLIIDVKNQKKIIEKLKVCSICECPRNNNLRCTLALNPLKCSHYILKISNKIQKEFLQTQYDSSEEFMENDEEQKRCKNELLKLIKKILSED